MGQADKDREVFAGQQVANEINKGEGTDYRAVPCKPDPPDARLVSQSGKHPPREVEVVRTPQDFTLRSDNQNLQKFMSKLNAELISCGIGGCHVDVAWTKEAVRHRVKAWHSMISELARIIAERVRNRKSDEVRLEISRSELRVPAVYNAVDSVSILRLPEPFLQVGTGAWSPLPPDGRWIEEAIRNKSSKYDAQAARKWILVIDGDDVDSEQVAAFRSANDPAHLQFSEIWVVTLSGTFRVKP